MISTQIQTLHAQGSVWTNAELAARFDRIAELLDAQNANAYRVLAYRQAGHTLHLLNRSAHMILMEEGIAGLRRLPGIGISLSNAIAQLVGTGTISLLTQLEHIVKPEQVLATVPGIGPQLAKRIHDNLGIETLIDLRAAQQDGRLKTVPGFGSKRLRAVRESLASRIGPEPGTSRRNVTKHLPRPPSVAELLDVDAEYRQRARDSDLPLIAPKQFSPRHESWLPILHTKRGENHYTALFSNTSRAHELHVTGDWVVIYRDDELAASQWTIVTEFRGKLKGQRVVRGRERECELHYVETADVALKLERAAQFGHEREEFNPGAVPIPLHS